MFTAAATPESTVGRPRAPKLQTAGGDPRQFQCPADAGLRHVRPRAARQLRRDQAEDWPWML